MQRILSSMLFISLAVSAGATTITIESATSVANAYAEENAWVLSTFGSNFDPVTLETFNKFTPSDTTGYNSLSTAVGTFSVTPWSQPGNSVWSSGTKKDQFTILDSADTPFSGRYSTTPGGGNWLDSNDITQLQLATSLNTVIFMATDVNDVGGKLTILTADGTASSGFAPYPTAKNGNLYFVAITSSHPIGDIYFLNSCNWDGYGLNDFGTVVDPPPPTPTPEPGTLSVAGFGLAAIALIRKFKAARSGASV